MNDKSTITNKVASELKDFFKAPIHIKIIVIIFCLLSFIWVPYTELKRIPDLNDKYNKYKGKYEDIHREYLAIKTKLSFFQHMYPEQELDVAVSKAIKRLKELEGEINAIKKREEMTKYVPFQQELKKEIINTLKVYANKYTEELSSIKIMSVNPSKDHYKKAIEIRDLFSSSGIKADYTNTIISANQNVFLTYPKGATREFLNDISVVILKMFIMDKVHVKESDKNELILYILGSPYFDKQGKIIY